ncbi:hypothetical protein [Dongia sp.]|uniref:hypothetical protein n=1 Tax=Dongia sp. TaxID=1977262 RepID=UPI0037522BE5
MSDEKIDLLVVVEGEKQPRLVASRPEATVKEVLGLVAEGTGRADLVEVFLEDGDEPLIAERAIRDILKELDKLLHVATAGLVKVTVEYAQKSVSRTFRPSATMERIIRWAIQPNELAVAAPVEDLQLKLGKDVVPADTHLGQVTHGHKAVTFQLVFKVKPQG